MLIDDIFVSLQGESTLVGEPTIFVRLFGCPLNCIYCDQPQKKENAKIMSVEQVLEAVDKLWETNHTQTICITGGEPLMQSEEVLALADRLNERYKETTGTTDTVVTIETNGIAKVPNKEKWREYKLIMDIKCPSSGVTRTDNSYEASLGNLMNLRTGDEVKFVIAGREDFDYALSIMKEANRDDLIYLFSPMFYSDNKVCKTAELLPDWLLHEVPHEFIIRLQIQVHKIIGVK